MSHAKKTARLRVPVRASIWYCGAALVTRATSFLLTPLFTRLLTDSEYGVYVVYQSWMSIIAGVMTLEIGSSALYSGFARYPEKEDEFTKSALIGLFSVFLAAFIPFSVLSKSISGYIGLTTPVLILMSLNIICDAITSIMATRERFRYGYKRVFAINAAPGLISGVIGLLLIGMLRENARIIGSVTASIACAIYSLLRIARRGKVNGRMAIYAVKSGLVLIPGFFAGVALANADKLIIAKSLGTDAAARYSIAHSVGLLLTFLTVGLFGALKPWLIRRLGRGETATVKEAIERLLRLGVIGTVALLAVIPELFGFLAPNEYKDALGAAYLLAPAVLPMLLSNVYGTVMIQKRQSGICSLIALAVAAADITLCTLLIPRFGATAAALAFLLSYLLYAVLGALCTPDVRINGKKGTITVLSGVAFSAFFYLLRGAFVIRLATLICLIPIGIKTVLSIKSEILEKD